MEQKFILTAFGKDRPGIVADIAEIIFEHQCNLENVSPEALKEALDDLGAELNVDISLS